MFISILPWSDPPPHPGQGKNKKFRGFFLFPGRIRSVIIKNFKPPPPAGAPGLKLKLKIYP